MHMGIGWGLETLGVEVPESRLVGVRREAAAAALADPMAAVRQALENPIGFPALRRALTPDDHVAIVVDEQLPAVGSLLVPILEHLGQAHIAPEAVTLVCPPTSLSQPWLEDLPEAFEETRLEVHDPSERKHLSYLASTRQGRRIYLNRTVVDADQVVLLTGRGYDPLLGYSGGEGALYPVLSDEATRQEVSDKLSMTAPGGSPWPIRREAAEVAWLLGAPFLVQVIEGAGSDILHVLGGPIETSGEGQRLLDARWRVQVEAAADVVLAGIGGDPARLGFDDLARAFACAARVVKPQGRIVLVCETGPALGKAGELLRRGDNPTAVLNFLREHKTPDMQAAFQWASAAQQATLYLLSQLPGETAEDLFSVPVDNPGQVQRLLEGNGTCLFLPDAHKTMAVLRT